MPIKSPFSMVQLPVQEGQACGVAQQILGTLGLIDEKSPRYEKIDLPQSWVESSGLCGVCPAGQRISRRYEHYGS